MVERRTFIVRFHAHARAPIVEDVATGERVRLADLASIAEEIGRRLDAVDAKERTSIELATPVPPSLR